jgi:hypothetical protein
VSTKTYLAGFAGLLRRWADRISYETAPHGIHWSFTFEDGVGVRFRDDGRGCPLWYLSEADTAHVRVDWAKPTVTYPRGSS